MLEDVLLASNKLATAGWAAKAQRQFDVLLSDYGDGGWSLACNWTRIGPGSIGWIIRADQAWGHVAGCLAVDGDPYTVKEKGGPVWYAEGTIFPWPREWWIDGARLHVAGWTGAPFGLTRAGKRAARFQSGVTLNLHSLDLIEQLAHPVAIEWADQRRRPGA